MFQAIKKNKVLQFLYGLAGVYSFASFSALILERIYKKPYSSLSDPHAQHMFTYPVSNLILPYLVGWLAGMILSRLTPGERVIVPNKNLLMCASVIVMAGICSFTALMHLSYPIIGMFKSCSVLSAIIVGVFFSRVRDHKLKLGRNKLIVGGLVTAGIFLFNHFAAASEKSGNYIGYIMISLSVLVDGFLPDFQAQVKSTLRPRPVDLMWQINRMVFFLAMVYSLLTTDLFSIINFFLDHPACLLHLTTVAFLNLFIQLFVYYLIKHFKQHIVPLALGLNKIFSVVLSMIWYKHEVKPLQIVGMALVVVSTVFDFRTEKHPDTENSTLVEKQAVGSEATPPQV